MNQKAKGFTVCTRLGNRAQHTPRPMTRRRQPTRNFFLFVASIEHYLIEFQMQLNLT